MDVVTNAIIVAGVGVATWVILFYIGRLARRLWPDDVWEDE